jgi:peptidoglycan hydrolase-like protein with peptidoglycan-binding domain
MLVSHRSLHRLVVTCLTALATVLAGVAFAPPAHASNVVTPGNFTGYGFDQCVAPTQESMDVWLEHSPFWAVGIYISGDSRFCRDQPNLTPEWVDTQLDNGWRLLPITLGPQAWCTTRDRYLKQERISPDPDRDYAKARRQGRREATETVGVAQGLGISAGSTLWYDIEAFDIGRRHCRESALSFLSAWTDKLHDLGYVSGVYSSAASGMRMLDNARVNRPGRFTLPDQVWIADWNGKDDVYSEYIRDDGWMPHARVHQYRGGHNETHGGVTINIDSNFLDLGRGSTDRRGRDWCDGTRVDFRNYWGVRPVTTNRTRVKAFQCMLSRRDMYDGPIDGVFDADTVDAVQAFRIKHDLGPWKNMNRRAWMVLTTRGRTPLLKYGAARDAVRRLQRALNAASKKSRLEITGVFEAETTEAVKAYQARNDLPVTGVVTDEVWDQLRRGNR